MLNEIWVTVFTLIKSIVGDVDVKSKGTLQKQIDDCFQSASNGKKLVADAVTGKGVLTKATDTFATMAANIKNIKTSPNLQAKNAALSTSAQAIKADTGYDGLSQVSIPAVSGTAGTGDVLAGKTFNSGSAGISKTGTMPNRGAWTGETTGNGNVVVPAGYHNGSGYVSGAGAYRAGVSATKKGTAGTGDVLAGKTFTNASSVGAAGAMANKGAVTVDAGAVTQDDAYTYLTVPSAAFYNASSKLRTKNSNIVNGMGKIETLKLVASANGKGGNTVSGAAYVSITVKKACTINISNLTTLTNVGNGTNQSTVIQYSKDGYSNMQTIASDDNISCAIGDTIYIRLHVSVKTTTVDTTYRRSIDINIT